MDRGLIELLAYEAAGDPLPNGDWVIGDIERFAALIAEQCAKACESIGTLEAMAEEDFGSAAMVRVLNRQMDLCAAAIREGFKESSPDEA